MPRQLGQGDAGMAADRRRPAPRGTEPAIECEHVEQIGELAHLIALPGMIATARIEIAVIHRTALVREAGRDDDAILDMRMDQPDEGEMRSEEHTSELQSLMRNSYAVFCLKKKKNQSTQKAEHTTMTTIHNHNNLYS